MLHLRHDECMLVETLQLAPSFLSVDWIPQCARTVSYLPPELLGKILSLPPDSSIDHAAAVQKRPVEEEAAGQVACPESIT